MNVDEARDDAKRWNETYVKQAVRGTCLSLSLTDILYERFYVIFSFGGFDSCWSFGLFCVSLFSLWTFLALNGTQPALHRWWIIHSIKRLS